MTNIFRQAAMYRHSLKYVSIAEYYSTVYMKDI
jgi:hypothetical protein